MFKDIYEEGQNVLLVPYHLSDLDDLYAAYSDPNVMELCMDGTTSKQWVEDLITWMVGHCYEVNTPEKIEKFGVSIRHKQSGRVIGWCGLGTLDCDPSEIELFYGLNSQYWRQGFGLEAAQLMLRYGFNVIGLNRIVAVVEKINIGSRRIVEKLHMEFEKTLKISDQNLSGFDGLDLFSISKEKYIEVTTGN
jgi:ribosomal-protein-alanine N-acetyltransferase